MDFMMEFINLFMVPLVGVFLYWKKARPREHFFIIGVYALLCVLNVIAVKFAAFFAKHLLGKSITKDSVTFTAAALICIVLISVLCVVFTDLIQIQLLMEKKDDCQEK